MPTRMRHAGFQYVIVRTSPGVVFRGALGDVVAVWTGAALEASVSFNVSMADANAASSSSQRGGSDAGSSAGDVGASVFAQIADMVARTQRSNMVSGLPTDCPTREKHGWLGDAHDTAVEAMYNLCVSAVWSVVCGQTA